MGFTRPETNKSIWRSKPDVLKDQSATVKADFDRLLNENSEDMVTMIEELEDKSGAGEIGAVAKDGVTASTIQAELNKVSNLEGVTATPEELNVLDGVVITTGELNYLDGVTSNVQAQINSKANTVHTHGNLSEDGKIGTAAGKVITTGTNGILQAETECTAFNKNYETNAANMKANAATASVGSADTIARGDHIHPTDTTRQASIGAVNGILKGDGAGNIVSAVGGTDYARVPAIEVVTGYEKAALSADIVETDTVNEALGKLEKKVESAISGGVNSVFGRSGTVVAQSGDYTAEQVGAIRAAAPYSVVAEADLDTWIDTQCLCAPASSGTLRTLMGSRCYVTQLFYNGVGTSYSRCQIAWGYTTTNIAYRYYYVSGSSGSWSEWGQVYTSTSGYGLGGNVKVAAGQDANQITATGFYSCDTNTPTSAWYFGYHMQRSDAYAYQRFINSFSFEIYERQKTAETWSAWEKTWPLAAADIGAANALQQSVTLYVSPSGSDTTGNGSESNPYQTITKALMQIPKNLNGWTAQIRLAEGTYNEAVTISGFYGGGRISSLNTSLAIIGGDNLTQAANYTIAQLVQVNNCDSIAITGVSINGSYFLSRNVSYLYLRYIKAVGAYGSGIVCYGTKAQAMNCEISNKTTAAIAAAEESVITCYTISGSNNAVGYQAGYAPSGTCGIIMLTNCSLTATTLSATYGGSRVFTTSMEYNPSNVTVSTTAPSTTLENGEQYQVYSA